MTQLESKLYVALLGARTVVSATANVNPKTIRLLRLVDSALAAYKAASNRELPEEDQEEAHADGN